MGSVLASVRGTDLVRESDLVTAWELAPEQAQGMDSAEEADSERGLAPEKVPPSD